VTRDLLSRAKNASFSSNIVADQLIATAWLAVDEDLLPSKLWHESNSCYEYTLVNTLDGHRVNYRRLHSKNATSTSVGQTSSPSLPAPRLFFIDFVGDDSIVKISGQVFLRFGSGLSRRSG
jgi:hypothetical protein